MTLFNVGETGNQKTDIGLLIKSFNKTLNLVNYIGFEDRVSPTGYLHMNERE